MEPKQLPSRGTSIAPAEVTERGSPWGREDGRGEAHAEPGACHGLHQPKPAGTAAAHTVCLAPLSPCLHDHALRKPRWGGSAAASAGERSRSKQTLQVHLLVTAGPILTALQVALLGHCPSPAELLPLLADSDCRFPPIAASSLQ